MQEVIGYNSTEIVKVENENIGAILIDFKSLQTDGSTLAVISDLNLVSVSLAVFKHGKGAPEYVVNGYLDDILSALGAGNTSYEISTKAQSEGYLVRIDLGGSLNLQGKGYGEIKVNAKNTAFTSLNTSQSSITIETVPAISNTPVLNIVETVSYKSGVSSLNNEDLGSRIAKVVLCNDFSAVYSSSSKAKATNGIVLSADGGYQKNSSENALISENENAVFYNPDTAVKHLALYNNNQNLLNNAKLSCLFDKAIDSSAKIMIVRRMAI